MTTSLVSKSTRSAIALLTLSCFVPMVSGCQGGVVAAGSAPAGSVLESLTAPAETTRENGTVRYDILAPADGATDHVYVVGYDKDNNALSQITVNGSDGGGRIELVEGAVHSVVEFAGQVNSDQSFTFSGALDGKAFSLAGDFAHMNAVQYQREEAHFDAARVSALTRWNRVSSVVASRLAVHPYFNQCTNCLIGWIGVGAALLCMGASAFFAPVAVGIGGFAACLVGWTQIINWELSSCDHVCHTRRL